MRPVTVNGIQFHPRKTVSREGNRWRVQIERKGESPSRASFNDSDFGGTGEALNAAHAWMDGLSVRPAYFSVERRSAQPRRLTIERRVRNSNHLIGIPRFTIEITPSKSAWRRPWMRIYIGTIMTINQATVDNSVNLLRARWDAFSLFEAQLGREKALACDYEEVEPLPKSRHDTRVSLADILAWNGGGEGVTYSPIPHDRTGVNELFWPELNAVVERMQYTIDRTTGCLESTGVPA